MTRGHRVGQCGWLLDRGDGGGPTNPVKSSAATCVGGNFGWGGAGEQIPLNGVAGRLLTPE
jgi:hypothetical protein